MKHALILFFLINTVTYVFGQSTVGYFHYDTIVVATLEYRNALKQIEKRENYLKIIIEERLN
jgi:hypothetical protein